MAFPQKVSLLRTKDNLLGLRHTNQSYVIGFLYKCHATEVRKYVSLSSPMKLTNYVTSNKAPIMNDMLHGRGLLNITLDNVNICENAHLTISKKININKTGCVPQEVTFSEFIMYPFTKNIGIILPQELLDENKTEFVFEAQVVEPSLNINLFQQHLTN